MADVAFVRTRKDIFASVKKAMELASWKKHVKGKRVFIKINCVSHLLLPGANTSPAVLDAVMTVIKKGLPGTEIIVGDSNTSGRANVKVAYRLWGYDKIIRKHDVRFIDLSYDKPVKVNLKGRFIRRWVVPGTLLDVDCIMSLPVIKCHARTPLTCSLKNQVGCLLGNKMNVHIDIDQAIADINSFFRPCFTIVDGTIGLEEGGLIVGRPKISDVVIASSDLVAADAVAARFMQIGMPGYISKCEEQGIGSAECRLKGDKFFNVRYKPAKGSIISKGEQMLYGNPLGRLVINSPLRRLLACAATITMDRWYHKTGKRLAEEVMHEK